MWQAAAIDQGIKEVGKTVGSVQNLKKKRKKGQAIAHLIGQAILPGVGGTVAKAITTLKNKKKGSKKGNAVADLILEGAIAPGASRAKDYTKEAAEGAMGKVRAMNAKKDKLPTKIRDTDTPEPTGPKIDKQLSEFKKKKILSLMRSK